MQAPYYQDPENFNCAIQDMQEPQQTLVHVRKVYSNSLNYQTRLVRLSIFLHMLWELKEDCPTLDAQNALQTLLLIATFKYIGT